MESLGVYVPFQWCEISSLAVLCDTLNNSQGEGGLWITNSPAVYHRISRTAQQVSYRCTAIDYRECRLQATNGNRFATGIFFTTQNQVSCAAIQ